MKDFDTLVRHESGFGSGKMTPLLMTMQCTYMSPAQGAALLLAVPSLCRQFCVICMSAGSNAQSQWHYSVKDVTPPLCILKQPPAASVVSRMIHYDSSVI